MELKLTERAGIYSIRLIDDELRVASLGGAVVAAAVLLDEELPRLERDLEAMLRTVREVMK